MLVILLIAAGHGGEGLCDGAAQLKTRAAAERCAAAGNHAADDGEPRAALGEGSFRETNQQEQEQGFHCGQGFDYFWLRQ